MTDFEERHVLITGGGSGMGRATAARIVAAGGSVVLAGRDVDRLDAAAKTLDAGERVLTVPADVSRVADVDRLIATTRERFGRLDGIFANAGLGLFGPASEVTEADVDTLFATNVKGVFFLVQRALPLLRPGSAVLLNASWTAHRGFPIGTTVYSATKAALLALAQGLAAELAGAGIRVNTVSPGFIVTEMFDGNVDDAARERFRDLVPLKRLGAADEVAEAAAFLLSSRASYITGQDLVVDGGLVGAFAA